HLGVDERVGHRLADQVVESVRHEGGELVMAGRFADPAARRDSPFVVTFRAVDEVTLEVEVELVGPGARAAPEAVRRGATGADVPAPGPWAELVWERPQGSSVFGGGVQFSHLDLAGRRLPVL